MEKLIVLSRLHVQPLVAARRGGKRTVAVSLDLGLTIDDVILTPECIVLPDGQSLSWDSIDAIDADQAGCFLVQDGKAHRSYVFSALRQCPYSLLGTAEAPTYINSGYTMHRVGEVDPHQDILLKIRAIAPIRGCVLDTVTGLGYTAIEAAKTADHVLTIELDPAVLELARLNPWSQDLFNNPRITQVIGDTSVEIQKLDDESFSRIIHDPPPIYLAGELYSDVFYRHLYRVLRRRGRLFHYTGNLKSTHGRSFAVMVAQRLRDAGFARVIRNPNAWGLVVYK